MSYIDHIDRSLFLLLNVDGPAWLDTFMWYASKMMFWSPVYLLLIWSLYQKMTRKNFWMALVGLAIILFMTDFMVVHLVKNVVMRLRPSHNPELEGLIHFVKDGNGNFYKGGRYGFFSNHASNYAGVVTYFMLLMRPLKNWMIALLITWVLLIVYSRIYLGVHYPGDVLSGLLFGALVAVFIHYLFRKLTQPKLDVS